MGEELDGAIAGEGGGEGGEEGAEGGTQEEFYRLS